jgi:hypothetical protein
MNPRIPSAIALVLIIVLAGCQSEHLPTHPLLSAGATQQVLRKQSHDIHTISAEGTITLTRPDDQSIRFDGAMVMRPPRLARVRAWKLGQAVFDLTLNDSGIWLVAPSDSPHTEEIRRAGKHARELARTLSELFGRYFDAPDLVATDHGSTLQFTQHRDDGTKLVCDVDRPTLTVRKYILLDPTGRQRFALILDRYAMIGTVPWPRRITAISESGSIRIDLRDIEINRGLAPAAFVPPRRAQRISSSRPVTTQRSVP